MASRAVLIGGFDHIARVTLGGVPPTGGVPPGGTLAPAIQTMWKDRLLAADLAGAAGEAIAARIRKLGDMGCALLRFAVPDIDAACVLGRLAGMVSMPLVADIHFDYQIALRCLDFPIAKIRINPGNIGGRDRVEKVLSKAAARGVPIRIGVNGGSLPADLRRAVDSCSLDRAEALVQAAERELALFDESGFTNVLVSMKASSIAETVRANRLLAARTDVPLHIGVTEAGPLIAGVTRNAVALVALLAEGIGATIRVSLSASMEEEVIAAREILLALADWRELASPGAQRLDKHADTDRDRIQNGAQGAGVRLVSCPRCGRNSFDTHAFTERWRDRLYCLRKDITVAVMGCAVNGPEEARHADLGITGAGNQALIFRHGTITRTIDASQADAAFREELEKL
jgi:(E)-4-hydroxy-3-methylbut-2-enyl-diphosphate synthase